MGVVTVIGVGGSIVNLPFLGNDATSLAQALANVINSEVTGGTLTSVAQGMGSNAPSIPGTSPGELILNTAGSMMIPGSANFEAIVVKANNSTILDNQTVSNQSVVGSGHGMNFFALGGSGTIVGAGGSPAGGPGSQVVIDSAAMGSWLIDFDAGHNTVSAMTGNDTIQGNADNSIFLGTGNDLVLANNQDTVQAGSGADTVMVNDRSGLPSGSGGDPLNASAYVQAGSGTLLFIASSSSNTVVGGTGSETIFGGSGTSWYQGGSGGDNWIQGAGTLVGGGDGDTVLATGSSNTLLQAGGGNESLSAAMSSGADTLVAGTGNDTLTLGSGSDIVQFVNGQAGGHDLVLGYGGADSVSLSGYGSNGVSSMVQQGGSVVVTLTDHTQITFNAVSNASNIHIISG